MILFNQLTRLSSLSNRTLLNFKLLNKFSAEARKLFSDKLSQGRYYQVLGFEPETNHRALTDIQIKRKYLAMIKRFHSDGVIDPIEKIDNQEISKCIITAFQKITQERIRQQIQKGVYTKIYNDEDQVAQKLFGKKFNQIKYELFKQENAQKRAKFMEQLEKIRKQSKYYQYVRDKYERNSSMFDSQQYRYREPIKVVVDSQSSKQFKKYFAPIVGVFGVVIYFFDTKNKQRKKIETEQKKKDKLTLGQEKIKSIEKKSIEAYQKKLNDLIDSFTNQQPPSLKYPTGSDPEQIDQLIQYTIAPDINLYEVSPALLSDQKNLEKIKQLKTEEQLKDQFNGIYDPFPLTKIKVNSTITLSLEAERCLQNIYISVKQVVTQIQQTGKYIPPKIFFRFYGYVMFQIRQKPLTLSNYRETEYVSLFDLFFDYYSPIPLKRHEYNEYLVGFNDEDLKMYGQVHLNHRKIPQRYITRNDKIVIMKDTINFDEPKYQKIWDNFYKKYMKIWNRGYSDRIHI